MTSGTRDTGQITRAAGTEPARSPDELRDEAGTDRFELVRDGAVVARMKYKHLRPNRYVLLHTEVEQAQRGQGIGGLLVEAVLDEIRSRQGTVTAICPFVADYLAGNEQHADVVDPKHPGYPNRAAAERGDGAIPM